MNKWPGKKGLTKVEGKEAFLNFNLLRTISGTHKFSKNLEHTSKF